MFLKTPEKLPFLAAVCWQSDIWSLTPEEMLHRYERGWRYRSVLAELNGEEAEFVKQLSRHYGSWIRMIELEHHQRLLAILHSLNAEFLETCGAYFGGGTLLTLKYDEYRVSKDIDFLCSSQQGYRQLRQEIFE